MSDIARERKSTWVTRRCDFEQVSWEPLAEPGVGDVLLCEVTSIGIHGRVETAAGARHKLYVGDRIACVIANRYATSLLEAVGEISAPVIDLVTASGLCGRVVQTNKRASEP